MAVDGTTHAVSDLLFGIGSGFRDQNDWLALLTGSRWSAAFYAGDSFGTFNSWMRLLTGLLCSFGLIGWIMPRLDK
jgi:hypothetical protein